MVLFIYLITVAIALIMTLLCIREEDEIVVAHIVCLFLAVVPILNIAVAVILGVEYNVFSIVLYKKKPRPE